MNDKKRCAGVDGEQRVPAFRRGIDQRSPARIPGVVDQDIEPSTALTLGELTIERLEDGRDGVGICQVRLKREGTAPCVFDGRDHPIGAGPVGVVGQRNDGSLLSKSFGNGATNASGAARHQCGFSNK